MILGRPTNLWLGLVSTVTGLATVLLVNVGGFDAITVATITGSIATLAGALIALVANQPPTVNSGDTVKVVTQTPSGQPNTVTTTTV